MKIKIMKKKMIILIIKKRKKINYLMPFKMKKFKKKIKIMKIQKILKKKIICIKVWKKIPQIWKMNYLWLKIIIMKKK